MNFPSYNSKFSGQNLQPQNFKLNHTSRRFKGTEIPRKTWQDLVRCLTLYITCLYGSNFYTIYCVDLDAGNAVTCLYCL